MRRLSYGTLLIGCHVALILLAVLCVAAAGASLLRRFADQQALERVARAGLSAEQALSRTSADLSSTALLLAAHPTLSKLYEARDARALSTLLSQFATGARLDGCSLLVNGRRFAAGGAVLPYEEIARDAGAGGGRALVLPPGGAPLALGASATLSGSPEAVVVVALRLGDTFAQGLALQTGVPVQVLDRESALYSGIDRVPPRGRAVDAEQPVAELLAPDGPYLAVLPLRAASGEVVGVIEAELPAVESAAPRQALVRSLLLMAIGVAAAATLLAVLLGRSLVQPIEALGEAARRIGLGDTTTTIPRAAGAEIDDLGQSLLSLSDRLQQLTTSLQQRQSEAEAIVTGIVEGVFAVDRERRIRYLNPQAALLLGVEPGEALGRFCGDVLNPQGADGVRPCEERCPIVHARFRGSARATEHLMLRNGARRSVVITSAASDTVAAGTGSEGGGALRQFQVLRDETDIEATRRVRDAVLANITHEFRTPLSAQLASIELLRDRLDDLTPAEVRELVSSLERGSLRLTQLIDNLLESVRIDAGQSSIRRQPVALDEVVGEAAALTSSLMALRGQRLHVQLPEGLPTVIGDGPRLVQVFVNLLANANKFAPAGTDIRVGGDLNDHEVTVFVEDEGPGLPPQDGPVLFERFMRSPGEEPAESGMGLGLWIVKSIVERHGGRVEARRRGGGQGTRMCVILPAGEEA